LISRLKRDCGLKMNDAEIIALEEEFLSSATSKMGSSASAEAYFREKDRLSCGITTLADTTSLVLRLTGRKALPDVVPPMDEVTKNE
jgi:hypothetical protein